MNPSNVNNETVTAVSIAPNVDAAGNGNVQTPTNMVVEPVKNKLNTRADDVILTTQQQVVNYCKAFYERNKNSALSEELMDGFIMRVCANIEAGVKSCGGWNA